MTSVTSKSGLAGLYGSSVHSLNLLQSPFLLLVRLYWGWQFAQSGWGKLHNLGRVTEYFASLNIPAPSVMAPMVASL